MAAFYLPFLLVVNLLYFALRFYMFGGSLLSPKTNWFWDFVAVSTCLVLQYFAYQGILEHAAVTLPNSKNKNDLVGGSSLDLLGITLLIQYGTVITGSR
jgi:hypothetical protein